MTTFLKNNRWSILWGVFIFILTLMPGNAIPRIPMWFDRLHPDKLVHLFIFAVFAFLLINGFRKQNNPPFIKRYALAWAIGIGLIMGGMTELLQGWLIPGRVADWKDFFADTIGTMGIVIPLWAHRFLSDES